MTGICEECAHEVRNCVVILRRALNPYLNSGIITVMDRDMIRIFMAKIEKQVGDKENGKISDTIDDKTH